MGKGLFRDEAVAAYQNPETRGGLLAVVPPTGRNVAIPLLLVVVLGVVAALLIRVAVTAEGRGVVQSTGGPVRVAPPMSGTVTALHVRAGDQVKKGAPLFAVNGRTITAPRPGAVDKVATTVGSSVVAHSPTVIEIIPSDAALVGRMTIPARYRSRLRVGDAVRIRLDEHDGAGHAQGSVERVGGDVRAADRASAPRQAGSVPDEPTVLVELRLDAMPRGVDGEFRHGMAFTGVAVLERERALALLLPRGMLR